MISPVILTRPLAESIVLRQLLTTLHIPSEIFPTLEIHALTPEVHAVYDYLIFISKNAVKFGEYVAKNQQCAKILAVGSGTARILIERGYSVFAYPLEHPSSASLLAMPEVATLRGQHIGIVRGVGGVDTLKTGLESQHNKVSYIEVYERSPLQDIAPYLVKILPLLENDPIILITSVDIFDALILHINPHHSLDRQTRFVVASKRIQTYLNSQGFFNIIVASVHDADIIKGVQQWLN